MNKYAKVWLITAGILILAGCVLFGGVMAKANWNFSKLSTSRYQTNRHEITEAFDSITIETDTSDIIFVASEDLKDSVLCYEQEKVTHAVSVKDGTLVIKAVDTRKWYEHIGIHFETPKVTICIPQGEYGTLSVKSDTGDVEIPANFSFSSIDISEHTGDVKSYASATGAVKVKTSTGDITIENISAGKLDLSVSTGDISVSGLTCEGDISIDVSTGKSKLTDVTCKRVISDGSTGSISLKNVVATESFSIERSTGSVNFDACDASEIFVETDTGNIKGSLLTEKVFVAKTDTGKIHVPNSVTGGRCEVTTDTGNITFEIIGQ